MKRVLIVCFNNLKNDARVTRQINFLKDQYTVTALCYDAWPDPQVDFFKIKKTKLTFLRKAVSSVFLLLGIHHLAYNMLYDYKQYVHNLKKNFDLIIANDVETLPLAFQIAGRKTKVYLDAHEFAPRQFEDRLYWRVFFQQFTLYICSKYIPKVAGMSTINNGIADAYYQQFGIRPLIITNATEYIDQRPIFCSQYPIRLVHHGIFTISRQPHIMLDLMELLDSRFTLDLIYLLPESASKKTRHYFEFIKNKALGSGKIKILPPLKGNEIVPTIHQNYDMGIILVPPVNFNYENGLPNKLFDCIQARLGMAVGPLREIARVVRENEIGVVSENFTAHGMASVLNQLTLENINHFKARADEAAKKNNASYNKSLFLNALQGIA